MPRYSNDPAFREKKRVTYRAIAPDGRPVVKHSYILDEAEAFMLMSDCGRDDWRACAVRVEPENWSAPEGVTHRWIPCKRVNVS